ncbi:MAG: BON domain-containing protein [Burkholderiales bacterium]|nr:BON domain-containing protein [Burkholderiales bacterium]
MNLDHRHPRYRLLCAAAASALALSLTACGDKPPAETATAKIESAAEVVARQAQQAQQEAAAAQKQQAAEEQQKAEAANKAADQKKAADAAFASKVKAAIVATPGLKDMAMDVRSSDGEVTLYGTADNNAQRSKAEKAAAGVEGVKSVKNELRIVRGS